MAMVAGLGWIVRFGAVALLAAACARPVQAAAAPDQPVPPGEPRAELRLVVDLPPSSSCDEDFDLGLYRNRGVDLVQWDDQPGVCAARAITIRYLPNRLTRDRLLERVRQLSTSAVPK